MVDIALFHIRIKMLYIGSIYKIWKKYTSCRCILEGRKVDTTVKEISIDPVYSVVQNDIMFLFIQENIIVDIVPVNISV